MYDWLLDDSEILKLVSLVNDLRTVGRAGQFQGQTYVVTRRPMKEHGREMIQLGIPIADRPTEDESSKDRRIESIPPLLQDVVDHLVDKNIVTTMPDCCIIDIFNEGDHSQPHICPSWFGRPVAVHFLTRCEMVFGRVIVVDHDKDYKGSLKLAVEPGWVTCICVSGFPVFPLIHKMNHSFTKCAASHNDEHVTSGNARKVV